MLTSGGSIDTHQDDLGYAEVEEPMPPDGSFAIAWASDGQSAIVSGQCPACGGRTAMNFRLVIGGTKGVRESGSQPASGIRSPLMLYCQCGHVHAGRPGDAIDKGCGRYWPVTLADEERRPPAPGTMPPSAGVP